MMTDEDLRILLQQEVDAIKKQGYPDPLTQIYHAYLIIKDRQEKENGVRSTAFLHASELPSCLRAVVLKYFNMGLLGDRSRRIFDNGHSFHDRMKKAFRISGVLLEEEGEVWSPDFRIGGSWDGLIDVGYGIELLELKSINQWSFQDKSKLPLSKHKQQVALYMYVKEVWQTRFYYECKNTQEPLEYVYHFDEADLNKVLTRSTLAWRYIDYIAGDVAARLTHENLPTMTCVLPNQKEAKICDCTQACFAIARK